MLFNTVNKIESNYHNFNVAIKEYNKHFEMSAINCNVI